MKVGKLAGAILASAAMIVSATPAHAGTDAYLGEIMLVGFTFCPRATTEADGQLLSISTNSALFSLYGTTYGGNGTTNFALPDLRGRVPIHFGTGPGLSPYVMGQNGGQERTTMSINEMPAHTHVASLQTAGATAANSGRAENAAFGVTSDSSYVRPGTPSGSPMAANSVVNASTGGSQSQNNLQPYLALRYCVVTSGIFPPRN